MRAIERSRLFQVLFAISILAGLTWLMRLDVPRRGTLLQALTAVGDWPDEPERSRYCVASELIAVEASDDFASLLAAASALSEGPTPESILRLMEDRGWTGLAYALHMRYFTDDGDFNDIGFVRRPYHTPHQVPEFLALLAAARPEADGYRLEVLGRRLDAEEAASYLGLRRNEALPGLTPPAGDGPPPRRARMVGSPRDVVD